MSTAEQSPSDLLAIHAQLTPDKVAVIDDRPDGTIRQITFAEMNAEVNRLANSLLARDLGPGDRVAWCGKNSIEVMIWLDACRKARLMAVPVGYRLTAEEAAYVVDDSDARICLVDAEHAALFASFADEVDGLEDVVVFAGEALAGQVAATDFMRSAAVAEPAAIDDVVGTMIYTSGTTGKPKGAVRKKGADPALAAALVSAWQCTPDDIHLTCGPLYHSGPMMLAGLGHALGCTLVVQRNFDALDWLRLIDRYRVTATFAAPTPIRMVVNVPDEVKARYDRSSMRLMLANAAPWPFALKKAYLADFPPGSLWEIYGATELGVCALLRPEHQLSKPGSCGQPAPYVEVMLLDDDGHEVTEPGQPGELFVRNANVLDEYHKAHDKWSEDHRDGGWHTVGDVAYLDDEGFLYICDRKKDMIISGGVNIYPAEIEAVLEHDPRIFESAVIGIPSEEWGESVHTVVVARSDDLTEHDVIVAAREHLASYKVPRSVSFVSEIPKTGTGKILKRELRDQMLHDQD